MGGICCVANKDKEAELKAAGIEDKNIGNLGSEAIPEPELEARFGKLIECFQVANERVRAKRNGLGVFMFQERESLSALTLKENVPDEFSQVYSGFWNMKENSRDYKGILQYADGSLYEGHFEGGKECGRGRKIFSELHVYEGIFLEGKFHGRGKFTGSKGDFYDGDWKDNRQDGDGTEMLADGQRYTGTFLNGLKHGRGKISWVDGSEYEGDFKDGKVEGEGTKTWKSGKKYVGYWADEKENGKGTLYNTDLSTYIGEFANGLKHGHGKLLSVNGDSLEGEWVRNKKHGIFVHSGEGKQTVQSEWSDGVLVKMLGPNAS